MTITLKQGDCLELMKEIPDESVDAVITDPPYNIGKDFANDNLNINELIKFSTYYLTEIKRVIKPHKPILIFYSSGESFGSFFNIASSILKSKKLMFFYKPNDVSMPLISVLRKSEALLLFTDEGTINYEHEENTHDVIIYNYKKLDKSFYHQTIKPIEVMRKIVKSFTKKYDIILDPFMGSGTTGVACVQLNRNFIGYEISPDYFKIAEKRINEAQAQRKLGEFEG